MKTTATVLTITICFLEVAMSAEKAFVPCFSDTPSVEAARLHLNVVGVESFFAEVQKANVAPPRIHSKYWVDTLPAEAAEERKREDANRDFGLELARQLDAKALTIYDCPDPASETNRLEWLLDVATWLRTASDGYGNYRIARRLEGIAAVVLARVITDLSVPNDAIERYFSAFLSDEKSATIRADILFEESRGAMDVREEAKRFSNKGNFEAQWSSHLRTALRHFGSMDYLFNYAQFQDRINSEKAIYSFFCEDDGSPSVSSVVNTWDYKQHYLTCIHGGRGINLGTILELYIFRKIIGYFPDIPSSGDGYRAADDIFAKVWAPHWQQYGRGSGSAGACYYQTIHNELMDFETQEIVSQRGKRTTPNSLKPRPQPK